MKSLALYKTTELVLSAEDKQEVMNILEANEWCTEEEFFTETSISPTKA